mmetsp:Transcript_11560/g.26353  ORF Transcript_11560/g.26353 Transcript_11560/m.26353 type:complete len:85 (-) Transcript_11560:124-378(-)
MVRPARGSCYPKGSRGPGRGPNLPCLEVKWGYGQKICFIIGFFLKQAPCVHASTWKAQQGRAQSFCGVSGCAAVAEGFTAWHRN